MEAPPKRYVNRLGVEVTYEELSEVEQDWYSLTSPQFSLEEWCRECEPLTVDQRNEVKAICDEICERLEKDEEFTYDLNELRGKTYGFLDEVWDEAMRMLRAVGWDARRTGAQILVRKCTPLRPN